MTTIRQVRAYGWAAAGSLAALAGCSATRHQCDFSQAPAGVEQLPGAVAVGCGECGSAACPGGCGGHAGGLRQKLREYDWEQIRPDHCWPTQYTHESIRRVNDPLKQQMVNGLALDSTLFDHHFQADEKKGELSEPGKHRLEFLARRRPYQVRTVTLQASHDQALDQARANEVQAYLQKVSFEPGNWQIAVAPVVPTGLSGPEIAGTVANATGIQGGAAPMTRKYESILRNSFTQGSGSGVSTGGGAGS
jgi:hypothetical protein